MHYAFARPARAGDELVLPRWLFVYFHQHLQNCSQIDATYIAIVERLVVFHYSRDCSCIWVCCLSSLPSVSSLGDTHYTWPVVRLMDIASYSFFDFSEFVYLLISASFILIQLYHICSSPLSVTNSLTIIILGEYIFVSEVGRVICAAVLNITRMWGMCDILIILWRN